jgi:hypothetical protein
MGITRGPNIVTDGLVFAVDAANPSSYVSGSGVWKDQTVNQNNGTLTNGPTFDSSNGGSIVFDGVNDYVDFGTNTIGILDEFTVSTWIYFNTLSSYRTWFSYGGYVTGGFLLQRHGETGTDLRWAYNGTVLKDGPTFTTTEAWTNIVCTGGSGKNIIWYVNNTQTIVSGVVSSFSATSAKKTEIGRRADTSTQEIDGNIGPVHIYNRALSAEEVAQNYNALKGRFGL